MKRYVVGVIVIAGIAGAAEVDGESLQGEWMLSSVEVQGMTYPAPAGRGGSIVFAKDGKLILKDPGKPDKIGSYTTDAGKSPKQLNLIQDKEGKPTPCIYEVEGDSLKFALSTEAAKGKRPSGFSGEKVLIVHLKRQKS
jgi:uncharacterized protein (TIGR03067 family)